MTTKTKNPRRNIEVGCDANADKTIVTVFAECADERTDMTAIGYDKMPVFGPLDSIEQAMQGELGAMLATEHMGRCISCQKAMNLQPDEELYLHDTEVPE